MDHRNRGIYHTHTILTTYIVGTRPLLTGTENGLRTTVLPETCLIFSRGRWYSTISGRDHPSGSDYGKSTRLWLQEDLIFVWFPVSSLFSLVVRSTPDSSSPTGEEDHPGDNLVGEFSTSAVGR